MGAFRARAPFEPPRLKEALHDSNHRNEAGILERDAACGA